LARRIRDVMESKELATRCADVAVRLTQEHGVSRAARWLEEMAQG
jgi:hypothetical protein